MPYKGEECTSYCLWDLSTEHCSLALVCDSQGPFPILNGLYYFCFLIKVVIHKIKIKAAIEI